jgi:hypothetical protein
MICHQTIFARKRVFIENGGFDEHYKIKADYEWLMRNLFNNATQKYIDLDIAIYKLGGMSDICYNSISVYEIPVIREQFYTKCKQRLIWKFLINPKILRWFTIHLKNEATLKVIDKFI